MSRGKTAKTITHEPVELPLWLEVRSAHNKNVTNFGSVLDGATMILS